MGSSKNTQHQFCALIVDDQKESTMVLTTMLERRGFKCYHAMNTAEATALLEEVVPHLLIVDVYLAEDSSGLDWLMEVRKGPFGFIPAVMLTGSGEENTVKNSMQIGVYDYVIKPATPAILDKKIASWEQRLHADLSYKFNAEDAPIEIEAAFEMQVAAISETGLCLAGCITNSEPLTFTKVESPLFDEIEIAQPQRVTLLNYEKSPAGAGPYAIRNFCQVSGWTEPDFRRIRVWVRSNQLGRYF